MHTLKAKLKRNVGKISSCFKTFLMGDMSDTCLPTRTLLYVSLRHIYIKISSFMGLPNSIRILYKTFYLTEWYIFLTYVNSWCTALLYFYFFSSIWRMQNIWSVIDLLRRNPPWWSPIISYAYGVNHDSRMSDEVLYVIDKSGMPL